jgi:hypothetical protein
MFYTFEGTTKIHMITKIIAPNLWIFLLLMSCKKESGSNAGSDSTYGPQLKTISYNGVSVKVVIDKPISDTVDALLAFHGTVMDDDIIVDAAYNTLNEVKKITTRPNIMYVSVAYPEEGLLMGDNVRESEAALLWVKYKADSALGVKIRKIFLVGHSQGGYIVTRLNTMHPTDGAIANGPGPLNMVLRCELEETGQIAPGETCALLRNKYGSVLTNPEPYKQRSLLMFTNNHQSDILFVQGLKDSKIQMTSWPFFKQKMDSCTNCRSIVYHEEPNYGHTALFDSPEAALRYNQFLSR